MKFKFTLLSLFIVLLYSCQSVPKNIAYFQDFQDSGTQLITEKSYLDFEPVIKVSDVLSITVSSPTKLQESVAQFNLPMSSYKVPGERAVAASPSLQTYLVDKDGYVNFPVVGRIKLGGYSLSEASKRVADEVKKHVPDPIINIEILSFTVTVMGEVLQPGPVTVKNGRITILEAIGAAGDMTIFGERTNVLLTRDTNGKLERVRIDLTKSEVFSSPYFYLQQNDVLYIEPNDSKKRDSNYNQGKSYNLSVISTVIGAVSMVATLIIAFSK